MGYLDYLRHGTKMLSKKGAMPVYMVYFITDACNAKCKHCLLADGAHPGWETPTMEFKRQELSLEEVDKITASMGKSLMFLLPTGGEPFLRKDIGEIVKIFYKNTGVRNVGIPTVGFTWYSLTDQVDWDTALREQNGNVNALGLYDLDRNIRNVGRAYKRLIRDWRQVLPASSLCLVVPIIPPSHYDMQEAREQEEEARKRLKTEEIDVADANTTQETT